MQAYIKGNPVEFATSYELFEKLDGELINFANATSAPASVWVYNSDNNTYVMTDSAYSNLRFDFKLEANVEYLFQFTFSELSGGAQGTIRNDANTTLETIPCTASTPGTYKKKYTPTESGTYSLRICGFSAPNSGVLTAASVVAVNAQPTYNSLGVASEIDFDLMALDLAAGTHTFVVQAKADNCEDSDYSNEIVFTV